MTTPRIEVVDLRPEQPCKPDCLHCHLSPVIAQFLSDHPEQRSAQQSVGEMAQVIGEFIGSGLFQSGKYELLPIAVDFVRQTTQHAAESVIEALKARRS